MSWVSCAHCSARYFRKAASLQLHFRDRGSSSLLHILWSCLDAVTHQPGGTFLQLEEGVRRGTGKHRAETKKLFIQ